MCLFLQLGNKVNMLQGYFPDVFTGCFVFGKKSTINMIRFYAGSEIALVSMSKTCMINYTFICM